jgi:hypothetical protein
VFLTCGRPAARRSYVSGDFRFRTGYCKSNPRKMVKMWAEKEMRNLSRLRAAGINSPAPVQLRSHVLVMEFIGACETPASRQQLPCNQLTTATNIQGSVALGPLCKGSWPLQTGRTRRARWGCPTGNT